MKRVLVILLVLGLAVGSISPATAKKKKKKKKPKPITFTAEGTIIGMNPLGMALFGITEGEFTQAHACGQMPASQGLDGFVIEIPEAFQLTGGEIKVEGSSPVPGYDLNGYFYSTGCTLMMPYLSDGADPTGFMPPGAGWIVIDSIVGADVSFVLTATAFL